MDPGFDDLVGHPSNQIFHVVFFPDRIYHAEYLNATRSGRYRYNVQEVRGKADINFLKGEVYLDGLRLGNFLRIEYRAGRLVETARERHRFLGSSVIAHVDLGEANGARPQADVKMHLCPWINAYQVELWETLEPPPGRRHDYQVLDLMGHEGSIVRVKAFADALSDVRQVRRLNLSFRENDYYQPSGFFIPPQAASRDDFYQRNVQVPNRQDPSSDENTVMESSYRLDFRRGWYVKKVRDIDPVRYRNPMMNDPGPDRGPDNIIEMRWVLQQEFGGSVVFFHEVTIPPGTVEGTHQHIGSEELYFITEGQGVAYMGGRDDPDLDPSYPTVTRDIFGIGPKACKRVPVEPGTVIFTKSGGIHGIENPGPDPLRFVAFLYHSS